MPHPLCSPERCKGNLRHRTNGEGRPILAYCLYHGTVVLPGYEQYVALRNEGSSDKEGGERRDYIAYRACDVCKKRIGILPGKGRINKYCPECAKKENCRKAAERYHKEKTNE